MLVLKRGIGESLGIADDIVAIIDADFLRKYGNDFRLAIVLLSADVESA